MKRLTATVLLAAALLSLTACGSGNSTGGGDLSIDLSAFYDTLFTDPDNDPALEQVTGEYLDQLYPGLSEIDTRQCLVYTPVITAVACEVALVEVTNADDAAKVQEIFQTRIDNQVNGGAWYPATTEAWQNQSEIVTRGNYVCLFVGDAKDDMVSAFNALS